MPVWIVGGQTATGVAVRISGTVDAAAATTAVATTTQTAQVTGALVWLGATQTLAMVSTVATVLGTVHVSQAGFLYTTTGVTTGTAQAVWIMNPTTVTVTIAGTTTGTVSLLSIVPVTTQTSVSISGLPVWFNPGALVAVSGAPAVTTGLDSGNTGLPVWPGTPQHTAFLAMVTVTSSIVPPTTVLFTVWTGQTQAVAGTTGYIVPAGKNLRINAIQVINAVSNVAQVNRYAVLVSTGGAPTMTSTVGLAVGIACPLTATTQWNLQGLCADVPAGATIAFGVDVGNTRHVIVAIVVNGYLY
jgi:hypothetical protein